MRRAIVGLLAVLPLAFGVAVAQADGISQGGDDAGPGTNGIPVVGTVVTTNPAAGSFTANAFIPVAGMGDEDNQGDQSGPGDDDQGEQGSQGGSFGGDIAKEDDGGFGGSFGETPPATTLVTITTNSSTSIEVNDAPGTVADMKPGDRFVAFFTGSPTDTIQTLVANPALAIRDHTPPPSPQVYAFVGSVTGVDTTAGTVTITVTRSFPSALAAANSSVKLTVTSDTLILGGSANSGGLFGNTLSNVSPGDIVAGGLIGPSGETLTQVEASPLRVLLDLPAMSSSTPAAQVMSDKRQALSAALRMLGVKSTSSRHHHHRSHKHHSRRHAKRR
jgi:hypothetical protein